MEIKINNIVLKSNCINGVIGTYKSFINDLKKIDFDTNTIYIDKKRLIKSEKQALFRKISIVDDNIDNNCFGLSVYSFMKQYILKNSLIVKDYRKKIMDSLKIVGLNKSSDKLISVLSHSELKLVLLAISLLSNPDIIIIDNFFNCFDMKNRKKIISLFTQLIDKHKKIVVICSNDSEFLYRYTSNLICFSNCKLLIQGDTNKLYEEDTLLLKDNDISIPKTILFTNLVLKSKQVRLNYNKDIRDLIKDIYKKV